MTLLLFEILLYLNHLGNRPPGRRLGPVWTVFWQDSPWGSTRRIEAIGQSESVLGLALATVERPALLAGLRVTKLRQYRFT
jgi:hypothetical protein